MIAITRDDMVVITAKGNGADRDRFLADVEMKKATHLPADLVEFQGCLFKAPAAKHLT